MRSSPLRCWGRRDEEVSVMAIGETRAEHEVLGLGEEEMTRLRERGII